MASPDLSLFSKVKTKQDFDRESAEFDMRKQDRLLKRQIGEMKLQKLSKDIESGGGGNDPAVLKIANAYLEAKALGTPEGDNRAMVIREMAKTQDKGIYQGRGGNFEVSPGYATALGNLARGEKFGGAVGKGAGELVHVGDIAYKKGQAELASRAGQPQPGTGIQAPISQADVLAGEAAQTKTAVLGAEFLQGGKESLIQQSKTIGSMRLQDDFIKNKADEVFAGINGLSTGWAGSLISSIPGTPQYDLALQIETLTADSGINSLLEAKAKGATFGALQEKELDLLIALKGNLDQGQSQGQLRSNLTQFMAQREKVFRLFEDQYKEDLTRFSGGTSPTGQPSQQAAPKRMKYNPETGEFE